ncbi:hypothetical protein N7467_005143 [Penicillium canescens]|nr:hypothetical protein N7467_005143 [Penicillium canescens]
MVATSATRDAHVLKNTGTDLLGMIEDYDIKRSPTCTENIQSETNIVLVSGILCEAQAPQFDPTLAPHPPVPYPVSNPEWWQDQYRKVPDFQPVNRELDREQRRQSPLFMAVGFFMIAGCSMVANWSSLWRNTVGQFSTIGVGEIGGEW